MPQRPSIHIRPMLRADIPFGMELSTLAGWNQLPADWEMLLQESCHGSFIALVDGDKVATLTTISYGVKFNWIGMMLVHPAFQRRGIGNSLLSTAVNALKQSGKIRLDATPAGKKLYDQFGFTEVYSLVRMRLLKPQSLTIKPQGHHHHLHEDLLPAIADYDTSIFGADRRSILATLLSRAPQAAYHSLRDGITNGYCLGREGRLYPQLGPLVADDEESARSLLLTYIERTGQTEFFMDVPAAKTNWLYWLGSVGFQEQRPFIRMQLGAEPMPEQTEKVFAIAGPEIG